MRPGPGEALGAPLARRGEAQSESLPVGEVTFLQLARGGADEVEGDGVVLGEAGRFHGAVEPDAQQQPARGRQGAGGAR